MTVFLLVVSLILNIMALMAIVILYLRQNKLLQVDEQQKNTIKEVEELISAYLLEMKDENERFIERMGAIHKEKPSSLSEIAPYSTIEEVAGNEEKAAGPIQLDPVRKIGKVAAFHAVRAYQKNTNNNNNPSEPLKDNQHNVYEAIAATSDVVKDQPAGQSDVTVQDLLINQLMTMKKAGYSVDEMAKRLNKGKTEIELLLKFRENLQE